MKRNLISILFLVWTAYVNGQELNTVNEIVSLAKVYRENHALSVSDNSSKVYITKYKGTKFERVANFVEEAMKPQNRIIEPEYMARPDSVTLKIFHTIIMVNYNMYEVNPKDNMEVAEKYLKTDIPIFEQLNHYYGSLFTSVINKDRPFDYSNLNWDLDSLGFKGDQEKAVFFLSFIESLGKQIYYYYTASRGPNWDGIESYVKLLPKINGKYYFQYDAFYFKDFNMTIYKKNRKFKEFYLPIFYGILVSHISMMEKKNFDRRKINDFLLSSILSQKQYYDYCNQMDIIHAYLKEKK